MEQRDAVIVAWGRSAVAKAKKGALKTTHPVDFAAQVLKGVLQQTPTLCLEDIGDVVVGCAKPEGLQSANIARLISLRAGLPVSVPAQTVSRFCSSGLQAVAAAANAILSGQEEVVVCGGVEHMSSGPMGIEAAVREAWLSDHIPGVYLPMGMTAENVAREYHISRNNMDEFAVESHHRAQQAQNSGWFKDQIIPVIAQQEDGTETVFSEDESIRRNATLEQLNALVPCFREDGLVTAGTSSPLNDGASFLVMTSSQYACDHGLTPIARFKAFAVGGVEPHIMGIGPIVAIPKALKKAGLTLGDIDTIELNEAFASQALACINTLGMNRSKVNPEGGAIALGHPMGATGGVMLCKAISHLRRVGGRYAMATMCIGGGQGAACIIEYL